MVHGWGGDEGSMWIFKQALPHKVAAITPRAPLALDNGGFIWFEQSGPLQLEPGVLEVALDKLRHFITSLPRFYPVDPTRTVLVGFSQGAAMSNAYAVTYPDTVFGVASLAGSMPPIPDNSFHANLLAGLPVFIAHGIQDNTVPVSVAKRTQEIYVGLGADVTYGEYPTAHKMNPQGIKDLKAWLAKLFPER
jgi:phospholipase/carboxylesterase